MKINEERNIYRKLPGVCTDTLRNKLNQSFAQSFKVFLADAIPQALNEIEA